MTAPIHVHEVVDVDLPVTSACRLLHRDGSAMASLALAAARERTATVVAAAGFRSEAIPTITAREPADGELGCLTLRLDGDEEATAWPALTATILVTPTRDGRTRLALVSTRSPGYDLSTNRIDKVWRDRLARTAVRALLTSLGRELERRMSPPSVRELALGGAEARQLLGAVRGGRGASLRPSVRPSRPGGA